MDPRFPVKEEYPGGSSSSSWPPPYTVVEYGGAAEMPRPMEGLQDMGPPPFLTKTYDMVDDCSTDHIVSWSRGGNSFVVWDTHAFSTSVLPRYFKHNNFSSFGFRKVDSDKWEFANEAFLQHQKHLLKNISRRKAPPSQPLVIAQQSVGPCVEVGRYGLDTKIDRLRRDKQILMMELLKLRQQQQNARVYLQEMDIRLQGTERKQQQMMSFLAKAMQNPEFISQLLQNKEKRKELEEAVSKKRRRPIEAGESSRANEVPIKTEPLEFSDNYGYEVSELEALALEMQGFGRAKKDLGEEDDDDEDDEIERLGSYERELDDGFWEELLNEGFDQEPKMPKDTEGKDDNVDALADRLGYLGSSPK